MVVNLKKDALRREKPLLAESGRYTLNIGWTKPLVDSTGFMARFDTVEEDSKVFFLTFRLIGPNAAMWRFLLGCIVCAAGVPVPLQPNDLEGAQFTADVEVTKNEGYDKPFYNLEWVGRCGA